MWLHESGRCSRLWDSLGCTTRLSQSTLGSLVATPSLLGRVIEFQGQDIEIFSIKDRVRLGTSDEGWVIHTNGSL